MLDQLQVLADDALHVEAPLAEVERAGRGLLGERRGALCFLSNADDLSEEFFVLVLYVALSIALVTCVELHLLSLKVGADLA